MCWRKGNGSRHTHFSALFRWFCAGMGVGHEHAFWSNIDVSPSTCVGMATQTLRKPVIRLTIWPMILSELIRSVRRSGLYTGWPFDERQSGTWRWPPVNPPGFSRWCWCRLRPPFRNLFPTMSDKSYSTDTGNDQPPKKRLKNITEAPVSRSCS